MLLPDFICIGAPKSGTTWLFDCLRRHPEIYLPAEKEIHFFNNVGVDVFQTRGVGWYGRFYAKAPPHRLRGDITPYYLREPYVPARIREVLPDCKLVALLRNPVERAYSDYWMLAGKGMVKYPFEELLADPHLDRNRILSTGLYAQQLKRYLEHFPKERILTVLTDDVKRDPAGVLTGVCRFLGVCDTFRPDVLDRRSNEAFELRSPKLYHLNYRLARALNLNGFDWLRRYIKGSGLPRAIASLNRVERSYPPLRAAHRSQLVKYYRADVQELAAILNRNLDHWLEGDSGDSHAG